MPFNTAVLFLVFNRPEHSERVFTSIRSLRPSRLYIAADGPREGNRQDQQQCCRVRELLSVDWPCEVRHLYREENLGCGKAVSGAIDWFFQQEEAGIILEDDCDPHPDFYRFAENMLQRYEQDPTIMHVSGACLLPSDQQRLPFLSLYGGIWGWATWRRAWQMYRYELDELTSQKALQFLQENKAQSAVLEYWGDIFEQMQSAKIDTWDFQWHASIWANRAFTVNPGNNLVRNIGFDAAATHTQVWDDRFAEKATAALPTLAGLDATNIRANPRLDRQTESLVFGSPKEQPGKSGWQQFWQRTKHKLRKQTP